MSISVSVGHSLPWIIHSGEASYLMHEATQAVYGDIQVVRNLGLQPTV